MTAHATTVPAAVQGAEPHIQRTARTAGMLYLLVIAGGLFSELAVRSALITPGDPAATTAAIAANPALWRWGLAVHLIYHVPAIVLYALLYRMFRPIHATLAGLALLFGMVSLTVEAVALLHLYLPVALIGGDTPPALGSGGVQSLTYLATELFSIGWAFGLIHFGGFCIAIGLLILRSGIVPRAIGALLIAAGLCYPVNSLTYAFLPDVSELLVPWILLPAFLGELSFALWLTTRALSQPLSRSAQ